MKVLIVCITLLFIVVSGVGLYIHDNIPDKFTTDDEYTPSQNLAITEGRFDDAKESINLMRMLNGKI